MSAAALTPRVRLMAICDGVRESKIEAGVFNLRGVRQEIKAWTLPFKPDPLWLFLALSSSRPGEFPGYILVVNEQTEKAVYFAHLEPAPKFEDNVNDYNRVRISGTFPEEGRYSAQVWFFQENGSDVLKGELPFTVKKEGI